MTADTCAGCDRIPGHPGSHLVRCQKINSDNEQCGQAADHRTRRHYSFPRVPWAAPGAERCDGAPYVAPPAPTTIPFDPSDPERWTAPTTESVLGECIEFGGYRNRSGYGLKYRDGKTQRAHRLAWIDANGPIPDGLWVLHRCDNPPCINVDHLFLGTQVDNMRDMAAKRRAGNMYGPQSKDSCIHGHAYAEHGMPSHGNGRECRTCYNAKRRERNANR